MPDTTTWPMVPSLAAWADTQATLHLWTQIVGKVKLALAPPVNHWWHVTFFTTARGLTTSPIPCRQGVVEFVFDFVDHHLQINMGDGRQQRLALEPKTVATFYREVREALASLGVEARIWPVPVEMPEWTTRFSDDEVHGAYDKDMVERWWQALVQADRVFKEFRGRFLGKCSPVHFFWGGFDHAVTRFSGRRAPERPLADRMQQEGYSHEVISAGFWPGGGPMPQAVFYAYSVPEPVGFQTAAAGPPAAFYQKELGEFVLPYEAVRSAQSPHDMLMEFLQSTYEAAATLAGWDREALER